jgi:MYXO-CTERM domain-containing protein
MLEPDREYCVSMTLYGRNDQAVPQVTSNNVCATVTNLDARPNINDASAPPVDTAPPDTRVVKDADFPSLDAGTDEPSAPPVSLDAGLVLPDASPPQPDAAIAPAADTAVAQGADATQPGDAVVVVLADAPPAQPEASVATSDAPASDAPAVSPPKKNGCGCHLGGAEKSTAPVVLWAALLLLWAPSRRRRAR